MLSSANNIFDFSIFIIISLYAVQPGFDSFDPSDIEGFTNAFMASMFE